MSEETTAALYPSPPPFYTFFTDENVERYKQLLNEGKTQDELSNIIDIRFLVPPKKPDGETYRSFGDLWWFEDKIMGLKESGVPQLYDDGNINIQDPQNEDLLSPRRIEQLKKLTKSLLLNYLELVGILSYNPTLVSKKIGEIRIILINIHHLLNSYRLHQSREAMILNYQQKIKETWNDVETINATCEKVRSKIEQLQKLAQESLSISNNGDEQDVVMEDSVMPINDQLESFRNEALDALLKNRETSYSI